MYLYNVAIVFFCLHGVEAKAACFGEIKYTCMYDKISLLSYLWGLFSTHKKSVQKRGEKTISNIYLPVVSEKNRIMTLNQI